VECFASHVRILTAIGHNQSVVAASQFARKRSFQGTTGQLFEAFDPNQLVSMALGARRLRLNR
jgi:hypothetical protein